MTDICRLRYRILLLAFLGLSACGGIVPINRQPSGVYHRVKQGETLYRIARAYDVSIEALAKANDIDKIDLIEQGSVLFIPGATRIPEDLPAAQAPANQANVRSTVEIKVPGQVPEKRLPSAEKREESDGHQSKPQIVPNNPAAPPQSARRPVTPPRNESPVSPKKPAASQPVPAAPGNVPKLPDNSRRTGNAKENQFVWPVAGKVVSRYGKQSNGMFHNGIKIEVTGKADIVAVADGIVIFSGHLPIKDYGETIIVKHDDEYASVYAHLGKRLVQIDERLRKDEKLATAESSGPKGTSEIHFEIRLKNKARNPLLYLP